MKATVWQGESETLYYVIDEYADESEQPAIVATISSHPPEIATLTLDAIKQEMKAIESFQWTELCYSSVMLKEQMQERLSRLDRRARQLEYNVTPLIENKAQRDGYEYAVTERDAIMRRFPNLVAHIICESLGYATPTHAASILQRAILGDPDYCEWIDACWKCNPVGPVRRAITGRHHHAGYMASFKLARALVQHYLDEHEQPVFASWF
jgi:hypothetical protein